MRCIILSIAIALGMGIPVSSADPVAIPDPALEERIRSQLGKPEGVIDSSEMETLKFVSAWGVRDLTGLEYAVNATSIDIFESMVSDLSPLSGLANLEDLVVTCDKELSDLEPLRGLSTLNYLNLQGKSISLLGPLSNLAALETLVISDSNVSDLSPLSGLSALKELILRNSKISDLEPLGSLQSLTYLDLNNNEIQSLVGLSSVSNLERLEVDHNQIEDLEPISNLAEINFLSVRSNRITEIDVAAEMRIDSLILDDNLISDLAPLEESGYIPSTLSLSKNSISDLSPIGFRKWIVGGGLDVTYNLLNLEEGGLQKSILDHMSEPTGGKFGPIHPRFLPQKGDEVVFGDENLEAAVRSAIDQPEGPITILDLESLIELEVVGAEISDLSGLEHAFNLTRIDLSHNHLFVVNELSSLPNLVYLDLSYNQLDGFGSFPKWENTIEYIDLSHNLLFNTASFMIFPNLNYLDVTCNPIYFAEDNKNVRHIGFVEEAVGAEVVSGGDCYELGKLHWKTLDATGQRLFIWIDEWDLQYSSDMETWVTHSFYDRSKIYQLNRSQARLLPLPEGPHFWRVRPRE